jgi:hypothetical protein
VTYTTSIMATTAHMTFGQPQMTSNPPQVAVPPTSYYEPQREPAVSSYYEPQQQPAVPSFWQTPATQPESGHWGYSRAPQPRIAPPRPYYHLRKSKGIICFLILRVLLLLTVILFVVMASIRTASSPSMSERRWIFVPVR